MKLAGAKRGLDKVKLRATALEIAAEAGWKLLRRPGPRLLFSTPEGKQVRLRVSNDRALQTKASGPDPGRARLDIAGADFLLFGVPTTRHGTSEVEAYLVPIPIAVDTVLNCHQRWLNEGARTKGTNKTFVIWLDDGPSTSDKYSDKWSQYRLGTRAPL
jgi:hypothetical protein